MSPSPMRFTAPKEEETLEYIAMPEGMSTFEVNSKIYEWDENTDLSSCKALLEKVIAQVETYNVQDQGLIFPVEGLNGDNLAYLNQLLGEGEVSAIIAHNHKNVNIQESIFTGIWRVNIFDERNNLIEDYIEVSQFPEVIKTVNAELLSEINFNNKFIPEGVINAPSIIVELQDKLGQFTKNHDIIPEPVNLTLLPHSPEDITFINKVLGTGNTVILSRGYGNCRITSTLVAGVWLIQYFNSTDKEILSTIDIVSAPAVACAGQEDLEDTAMRLKEFAESI